MVPREEVINYSLLPISLLAPQLGESPSCLLALHKSLAAKALVDSDGERERGNETYVFKNVLPGLHGCCIAAAARSLPRAALLMMHGPLAALQVSCNQTWLPHACS